MALLDLPEVLLDVVLSQLGTKHLLRFSFVNKYALARARARIARLPDKDWRIGLGDPRSQATVYYRREEQTGAEWQRQYEQSIVLWDEGGGARLFPRTAACYGGVSWVNAEPSLRGKHYCEGCVTNISYCRMEMPCCGALVCGPCGGSPGCPPPTYRANCVVCGANQPHVKNHPTAEEEKYLLEQLQRLATEGRASAQFELGRHYYFGFSMKGVEQCYETALNWLERAARQGHAAAQFFAASCLDDRRHAPGAALANLPRRAEYLAMASAQHFTRHAAIKELGSMYLDGKIPTPDAETRSKEAVRLFKFDIEWGGTCSYVALGRCYLRGLPGVPADRDEAERVWQEAMYEFNDADAREQLEINDMVVPDVSMYFGTESEVESETESSDN